MCNIAGYIGTQRAAPVLLDMLEREEGWGGGYYTGIATLDGDGLHMRKVVGDVARLREETDAEGLPGHIGIAHSRSRSGGDRAWAHPFLSADGNQAYVANGALGVYKDVSVVQAVADRLRHQGIAFESEVEGRVGDYPELEGGRSIHFSDLMCALIDQEIAATGEIASGFGRAYAQFPGEIVGLILRRDDPDAISVGRINMPMMIGRHGPDVYLATTAMAFPPEQPLRNVDVLPAESVVRVDSGCATAMPLGPLPVPVAELFPWHCAVPPLLDRLADGEPRPFGQLSTVTKSMWPEDAASQNHIMIYELIRALVASGGFSVETHRVEGAQEGLSAPRFVLRKVER